MLYNCSQASSWRRHILQIDVVKMNWRINLLSSHAVRSRPTVGVPWEACTSRSRQAVFRKRSQAHIAVITGASSQQQLVQPDQQPARVLPNRGAHPAGAVRRVLILPPL